MSKKNIIDDAEMKQQLDYARSLKDEDIDRSDPEARELSAEQWKMARPFRKTFRPLKTSISLRIDNDVLDYFKQKGNGYQTRLNQALRTQMEAEQGQAIEVNNR